MSRSVELVTIFLASPADMLGEREVVRSVVRELNRTWSRRTDVYFEVVGWEEVPSGIGSDPQEVVNLSIGDDYDVFLGLMGRRLGSLTNRAASGTVEEYERALNRWRLNPDLVELKFYFLENAGSLAGANAEELALVEEFRERLARDGVFYRFFENESELALMLSSHLGETMQAWEIRLRARESGA